MSLSLNNNSRKKSFTAFRQCENELFKEFLVENKLGDNNKFRETKYLELKQKIIEEITEQLYNAFPELKGCVEFLEAASPVTYHRFTSTEYGSTYGLKQTVNQIRLDPFGRIKGLYLAGQSLTPGILGAIVTSLIVVAHIIGPEKVFKELKSCL